MRKKMIFLCVIATILLTSCGTVNDLIEGKLIEKSGLVNDENYINYVDKENSGIIDEDGYYKDVEVEKPAGKIHITFSTNNNLKVNYYSDDECSILIDTNNCYLEPGDSIIAIPKTSTDISSSEYSFSEFIIYNYDHLDNWSLINNWIVDTVDDKYIINIPENFDGDEVSINPTGNYQNRQIMMSDYYYDDNNSKVSVGGQWYINGKVCENPSDLEISPTESYIISYKYDPKEYFFISSEPECYYNNDLFGEVIFKERESTDKTVPYNLELKKCFDIKIVSAEKRTVRVNSQEKEVIKAGCELDLSSLKYGDKITISTNKSWDIKTAIADTGLLELESVNEYPNREVYKYEYNLCVIDKNAVFIFDPAEYQDEHGRIIYTVAGREIKTPVELYKGQKIFYKADLATVNNEYWLPDTSEPITVSDPGTTSSRLHAITLLKKVPITVILNQPSAGGSIYYTGSDGNELKGTSADLYNGETIYMKLCPWSGWIFDGESEASYTVTDTNNRTVTYNGISVNNIFKEQDNHKPELSVVLENEDWEEIGIAIEAANGYEFIYDSTYDYDKTNLVSKDVYLIEKQKIGTQNPISISFKNYSIESGKAIKVLVNKKIKGQKKEVTENIYIDNITDIVDKISFYGEDIASDSKIYESIDIFVGIVAIDSFECKLSLQNAVIVVKDEYGKELQNGDLIEPETKVTYTFIPNEGFYIEDANDKNNTCYENTVKYSKLESDMESKKEKHMVMKYCVVKLDSSDSFSTYKYKYDGKVVTGEVSLKPGKKLYLDYEITDDKHSLAESAGGVFGIGSSDKKVSGKLELSMDYDGKTITKEDFGITLKGE